MYCDGEDELVVFAVKVVEVVSPDILDVPRVYEAVAVGRRFDEHHGWQIVQVPICWNLHKSCVLAFYEGLHPFFCLLLIVDLRPSVARPEIVGLAVVMAHAVVIFDAVVEEELGAFLTCLPPDVDSRYQRM